MNKNISPEDIKYERYKTASHPLLLITSFLIIPLADDGIKGLMGNFIINRIYKPDLIIITALSGILLLLLSWIIYGRELEFTSEARMNIAGAICLFASILLIKHEDRTANIILSYVLQGIPLILVLCFLVLNAVTIVFNLYYHWFDTYEDLKEEDDH